MKTIFRFVIALLIILPTIDLCKELYSASKVYAATTTGNLKYDVAMERIVVSCRDHQPPRIHTVDPGRGAIVVVDCEREK